MSRFLIEMAFEELGIVSFREKCTRWNWMLLFFLKKKVMNGNFNWFLSKFCLRECMRHVCPPLAVEEFYENMKSDESTSKTWNDFSLLTDRSDRDPAVQLMDRLKSIIILRSSNVHWNWFYDRLAKYHLVKNSSVKSKDHTEFWLLKLIINWPRFWKTWFGRMTRFFFYEKHSISKQA